MTTACTGSRISLRSASPADGWRVSTDATGPDEVEVKFDSGQGEVTVRAQCSGGTPAFQVESSGGGD
ncbi:MAG: hypothetical protein ABI873_00535 [Marmoricola sp.]